MHISWLPHNDAVTSQRKRCPCRKNQATHSASSTGSCAAMRLSDGVAVAVAVLGTEVKRGRRARRART
eukprot:3608902-Pleurochrysis_carterae.AAC.3